MSLLSRIRLQIANVKLTELNQQLEGLDLTTSVRDPLYRLFVDEMTAAEKREGLQVPVLTKEQQERRKELAREILQKLRDTRGQ